METVLLIAELIKIAFENLEHPSVTYAQPDRMNRMIKK